MGEGVWEYKSCVYVLVTKILICQRIDFGRAKGSSGTKIADPFSSSATKIRKSCKKTLALFQTSKISCLKYFGWDSPPLKTTVWVSGSRVGGVVKIQKHTHTNSKWFSSSGSCRTSKKASCPGLRVNPTGSESFKNRWQPWINGRSPSVTHLQGTQTLWSACLSLCHATTRNDWNVQNSVTNTTPGIRASHLPAQVDLSGLAFIEGPQALC